MKNYSLGIFFLCLWSTVILNAQTTDVFDDFEGNGNISNWFGDDCDIQINRTNPFVVDGNMSPQVLEYHDVGGQYANVRFEINDFFELSTHSRFSLKVYIPSNGVTGNQPNQISLKLQDGRINEPWTTQSEIIKSIELNTWQTVIFDFKKDNFINLNPGSLPPTARQDFNRIVIQLNGENNNDEVLGYLDDIEQLENEEEDQIYDYLVWSDEFDVDGPLDSEKWFQQSIIPNGESWFNGEVQHYTDRIENSYVENGVMKITAKKENYTNQGITKNYTSARLNSKYAFTYGRVDVRAKLPFGVGTWPAIWLLGQNINENGAYWQQQGFGTAGWPACGEIDIMEHWGDNQDFVQSAMHTPSSFGNTEDKGGRVVPNASTEFHVYSMVWSPEKIVFSVDGFIHYTYEPENQNPNTWPFDDPQYLIFNIAILPIISPSFVESSMEVDYVRVYQESPLSTSSSNQNSSAELYPNPVSDRFSVDLGSENDEKVTVKIFTQGGTVVDQRSLYSKSGRIEVGNLENLPAGLYFVVIERAGKQLTMKFKKV